MSENKKLLIEELSKEDVQEVKELIKIQLTKLFYTLYIKKNLY